MPDIETQLHLPLQDQGLTVIGVAAGGFGEDDATLDAFLAQTNVSFPIVWDDGTYGQYAWPPALSPFPRQVLVDQGGVVRYLASEHRQGELTTAVQALLAE